jgi:PAS domain S-box-containing protein
VTERKQAELVLQQTEELYRRAIAGADAVPYSYDYKTRSYLFMGEGVEQLIGYTTPEVTPQLWKQIIQESVMAGETAGLAKDEAAKRVTIGEIRNWRCDMRVITRDGKSRWISDASVQSVDESGQATGSVGVLQDITERKQAEISAIAFSKLGKNLNSAASPEQAAEIISEISGDLFQRDACWIKLYNASADTIYSIYEMDTAAGNHVPAEERAPKKPSELHRRIITSGGELILRDKAESFLPDASSFGDKSRPSASLLFVPIRYGERVIGILSVQSYTPKAYDEQDLTMLQTLADQCGGALERIWADEALRKSEAQLRQIEELYRYAIASADAVPYSYDYAKKAYVFMGKGIEQLIGYSPEELNGEVWKSIIQESVMAGETVGLDKEEAARRVKAGEIRNWRCDMRVITRKGKSRWISDASVQNLDESGHTTSVGILQDITERKQAEISAVAFSKLGKNLSSAASAQDAAKIISEVANDLIGWDACYIQMYSETNDTINSLFDADTMDGERIINSLQEPQKPTSLHQRILKSGAELILRDNPTSFLPGGIPFGNKSRPSASLMYVPIRSANHSIGILSVQSYKTNAYDDDNLKTLQTLADQCGGAMERIRAGEAMRKSESQFRLVWETSADGMRLANCDGIVLMANNAYCRMVEKTKAEVEGKDLSVFHWKDNQEYILQKHREEIAAKSFRPHLEKEVMLWNGKKIWFELSNSLLELPDQPPLILTIFRDITQRKQAETQLENVHRQLVDTSRQAGMAEVATSVLHNVGNVLNSVNVSSSLIRERVKKSRVLNLNKIAALFQEHDGGLPDFFANDPRGKQLPGYVSQLAIHLSKEREEVLAEIGSLVTNIEHIKEIVAMQQSYAKVSGMSESLQIVDLVEDALRMNAGALDRHQVQVIREYSDAPQILVEKHKVLQILINLIRNAKYACDEAKRTDKFIRVRVTTDESHLIVAIIDNGIGIPPENLTRIFNHGFTTRKDGHGFGLHSGALAAIEIGGSLNVHSDGPGKGAEFTLKLPSNHLKSATV